MKFFSRCPICGHGELAPFALDPWMETRLHVAQAQCRHCRLILSQPQADSGRMKEYYEAVHFENVNTDAEQNFHSNRAFYGTWDFPIARRLWREWPPPGNGRALEVGCGYGGMLSVLADHGFDPVGTEMSARCAAFCRSKGFTVLRTRFPGLPFASREFDAVFAMHVVEHVSDPGAFVKELVSLARPGGVVVLATEDAWCAQYQWHRLRARILGHLPPFRTSHDHTFVFQAPHLRVLLRLAGCDVVKTRSYHAVETESLHWKLYKGFFRNIDRLVGHGDYLIAAGRRANDAPEA